jgi:GNAT superfamily N-acetyltransferase
MYAERALEVGGSVVMCGDAVPDSPMLNRIVGLGVDEEATEAGLDAAIDVLQGRRFYVAVSPSARPRALERWLLARGFEPGWGWMQFVRSVDDVPFAETKLVLVEIGRDAGAAFAGIVTSAYGLPEEAEAWIARAPDFPGWTCWLACDDDEPVGAAALFVDGDAGYLGFAGTLAEHRGKGAQGALLAARVRRARDAGCTAVYTETGEQLPDRPSNSYRNILRAGFTELHVVANFISPSPSP